MTNYNFFEAISKDLDNEIGDYGNINDYLCDMERDEVQTFEDLTDILQDAGFFDVEIIYSHKAMKFLAKHDPSLCESLQIAEEYDYRANQLNSELLASLLASQMLRDYYNELRDKIEEHLTTK